LKAKQNNRKNLNWNYKAQKQSKFTASIFLSKFKMSRMNNSSTRVSMGQTSSDRLDTKDFKMADSKIWRMLHMPKHAQPNSTGQLIYTHQLPEDLQKMVCISHCFLLVFKHVTNASILFLLPANTLWCGHLIIIIIYIEPLRSQ
jgi:hypothetical protein